MGRTLSNLSSGKPSKSPQIEQPTWVVNTEEKTKHVKTEAEVRAQKEFVDKTAWAIRYLAERNQKLTADDVWSLLDEFNCNYTPEPRIVGVAMVWAKRHGIIYPLRIYQKSHRRQNHHRLIMVWLSLIYPQINPCE